MPSNISPPSPASLSVSVVVYHTDAEVVFATVDSLLASVLFARSQQVLSQVVLHLVHNGDSSAGFAALADRVQQLCCQHEVIFELFEGHGNVGYGRGHNLSIRRVASDFHLVLNPDVVLTRESLVQGIQYLQSAPAVAALSPAVCDAAGHKQHACKRFPTVLDFVLRGFAPQGIRKLFDRRLARYEMRDLSEQQASTDIPIISGCFMLFRTPALQAVNGFDEGYFLYFEDFDLSLRVQAQGQLAYLPDMQITHLGGYSARKGLRHIAMFARSGCRFYNTHGWRLL